MQAPTTNPGSSFGVREQKPDRLSLATYNELPGRYQKIAQELARQGEIVIGDMMGQPSGVQENGIGTLKN